MNIVASFQLLLGQVMVENETVFSCAKYGLENVIVDKETLMYAKTVLWYDKVQKKKIICKRCCIHAFDEKS